MLVNVELNSTFAGTKCAYVYRRGWGAKILPTASIDFAGWQSDQCPQLRTKRKARYVRLVSYLLDRGVAGRSLRILGDCRNGCVYSQSSFRDIPGPVSCLAAGWSAGDLAEVRDIAGQERGGTVTVIHVLPGPAHFCALT